VTDVVHPGDVIPPEPRRRARLAQEALHEPIAAERVGQEELDGEKLAKPEVPRGHDDAHSTFPEDALDAIFAQ
jgi:hypothetical protein